MTGQDVAIELKESGDVVDGRRPASVYHSKRSAAEGMMDLSLLTANANQLKFILYYNQSSRTFYPALAMVMLSLLLQIMVGFLLIFRRRFKSHGQSRQVSRTNEYLVSLIFLITIINIMTAVLTTTES